MKINKTKWTLKKIIKTIWMSSGVLFMLWLLYSMQAHNVDESLLRSDNQVRYENKDDYYSYTPTENYNEVLVFYPGALVQTKAYLPLCREIAKNNIKVYLIKMPWRQATIGYNKPKELNILAETSKTYTLAGHSQGGKMAAQFVYENPSLIDRLILIGTTHPRDISLADHKIPILKIYGSKDGVADEKSIIKNKSKLPEHSQFVKIDGANHSQFGYYGFQLGDDAADIDRKQQHVETLKAIMEFISNE
ncbi:alpha/beta hydrolase [Algoriphagus sp. SE2]|uniref:alpha/beta hydrolase n=1 Tax=Algoriphagus sp. SE2 TaxID=3141536 RepID=UPI0031CCFF99